MFDLALQGIDELTILSEYCQVEVIVVVCHQDLSGIVDPHPDWIVGYSLPPI